MPYLPGLAAIERITLAKLIYTDASGQTMSVPLGPEQDLVVVGRATDCHIHSNRKSVSRRHAEFIFQGGGFEIHDLGSSNGTWLVFDDQNRQQILPDAPIQLNDRDEIWCGDFIIRFEEGDDPSLHPESVYEAPGVYDRGPDAVPNFASIPFPDASPGAVHDQPGYAQVSPFVADPLGGPEPIELGAPKNFARTTSRLPPPAPPHGLAPSPRSPSYEQSEGARTGVDNTHDAQLLVRQAELRREELERELERERAARQHLEDRLAERGGDEEFERRAADSLERAVELERLLENERERIEGYRRRITVAEEEAARAQSVREELRSREREVEAARDEIARAREETRQAREETRQAREEAHKARQAADRLRAQLEASERQGAEAQDTTRELERHRRLLGEFERRNRELQEELGEVEASKRDLESVLATTSAEAGDLKTLASGHEERLAELTKLNSQLKHEASKARLVADELRETADDRAAALKGRLEALREELEAERGAASDAESARDEARQKADELTEELERQRARADKACERAAQAAPTERALRLEIEGLKQRIKLERERKSALENASKLGGAQGDARARSTTVEMPAVHRDSVADLGALRDVSRMLASLERVVDAVARLDLGELNAVDRVRLRSAMRESDPRHVLKQVRAIVGGQIPE